MNHITLYIVKQKPGLYFYREFQNKSPGLTPKQWEKINSKTDVTCLLHRSAGTIADIIKPTMTYIRNVNLNTPADETQIHGIYPQITTIYKEL